jgi:hypothetical protein
MSSIRSLSLLHRAVVRVATVSPHVCVQEAEDQRAADAEHWLPSSGEWVEALGSLLPGEEDALVSGLGATRPADLLYCTEADIEQLGLRPGGCGQLDLSLTGTQIVLPTTEDDYIARVACFSPALPGASAVTRGKVLALRARLLDAHGPSAVGIGLGRIVALY